MADDLAGVKRTATKLSSVILVFLALVTVLLIVITVWWQITALARVDSFEKCAQKYPVMDTYPQQCRTPDGRLFTQDIAQ